MAQDADVRAPSPPGPRWAGFWIRALAVALDAIGCAFAGFYVFQLSLLFGGMTDLYAQPNYKTLAYLSLAVAFGFLLLPVYSAVFHASRLRATPGKLTTRICVVDRQGRQLGFWRALAREAAKALSLASLTLGFVMAAFTREKTALHDLIAGSRVVRLPPRAPASTLAPVRTEPTPAMGDAPVRPRAAIGRLAYVFAGVGAVPVIGWPFGIAAMIWGLVSRKANSKRVAAIAAICSFGMAGFYALIFFTTLLPMIRNPDVLLAAAKPQIVLTNLNRVRCHIDLFRRQWGRYPADLQELYVANHELDALLNISDLYGAPLGEGAFPPFHYEPGTGPHGFELYSIGRDGEAETGDDIHAPANWSCPAFSPMTATPDEGRGKRDI